MAELAGARGVWLEFLRELGNSAVRAGADRGAQPGGAELQAPGEPFGEFGGVAVDRASVRPRRG